jgi:hypothetical protein
VTAYAAYCLRRILRTICTTRRSFGYAHIRTFICRRKILQFPVRLIRGRYPADSKRPSKLLGAWARRAAWRIVLENVALGHGNRVVQRKSPPLVGFTSLPVASLLLPATAAASPPQCQWKRRPRHHRWGNCHLHRLVGCLGSRPKLFQ